MAEFTLDCAGVLNVVWLIGVYDAFMELAQIMKNMGCPHTFGNVVCLHYRANGPRA